MLSDRLLCCNEAILASYPFLDLLLLREGKGCTLRFVTPDPRRKKSKLKKWQGGHKSNAESKHIYCSFISIHHRLNPLHEADAKPQFASYISSLDGHFELGFFASRIGRYEMECAALSFY